MVHKCHSHRSTPPTAVALLKYIHSGLPREPHFHGARHVEQRVELHALSILRQYCDRRFGYAGTGHNQRTKAHGRWWQQYYT